MPSDCEERRHGPKGRKSMVVHLLYVRKMREESIYVFQKPPSLRSKSQALIHAVTPVHVQVKIVKFAYIRSEAKFRDVARSWEQEPGWFGRVVLADCMLASNDAHPFVPKIPPHSCYMFQTVNWRCLCIWSCRSFKGKQCSSHFPSPKPPGIISITVFEIDSWVCPYGKRVRTVSKDSKNPCCMLVPPLSTTIAMLENRDRSSCWWRMSLIDRYSGTEQPGGLFHSNWSLWVSATVSLKLMRSCARHLLVAASSRRTLEKVASRSGSGRHWRSAWRALLLSLNLVTF